MPENFAVLDAINQSQPTDFAAVDANMMFKSDESRVATAMDSKLFVNFFTKPVKHEAKSLEAGRAIFETHEFVNIKIPGDKNNDVVKDLSLEPHYIQRFPVHYARFKKNQEQIVGTPLNLLPFLTEAQVEEYRTYNIRTVEQLAGLADVQAQTILGSIKHKQEAQAWLDSFRGADELRKEFAAEREAQAKQISELQAKIDALSRSQVRK
jgi:hypothetical protein